MTAADLQRDYYRATAAEYDASHISASEPEHDFALAWLTGAAAHLGFTSFLDVGAGTGRGVLQLQQHFPDTRVAGIEPVSELRQKAHEKGVSTSALVEGDACALPFADGEFDCVLALGVMHHLASPRAALREMHRVSRRAVFISDTNNFGCGSLPQRLFSHTLRVLRLWKAFQFIKNGFKPWKNSPGDGVHYSYSLFDDISFLRSLGCDCHLLTTRPSGPNPYWTASHIAVLAHKSQ
ncbi:MAG: methyltransferase type 11 [Prosthecobacter sp.]|nr:methyltransferase type 11 [Prosthecobacter sp.]